MCAVCIHSSISVEGVRASRHFSPFSSFRERRDKRNFWNFQTILIFLAQIYKICWETSNSRDFAMISLL